MNPLERLLQLLALNADLSALTDAELATLDADIASVAEEVGAGELSDETLAAIEAAGTAVQAIRATQDERTTEAADRAGRAQAALALVRGEQAPEGEGEPEVEAEPEVAPEAAPEVEVEVEVEVTPQAVAAAAAPRTPVAVRRPAAAQPRPTPTLALPALGLVASANAPGIVAGAPINDYDQLATVFLSAFEATKGYRHGPPVKVPVVRRGNGDGQYPDAFHLGHDVRANAARIAEAQHRVQQAGGIQAAAALGATAGLNSLPASGGICAPINVSYDMPTLGTDARPVRDGLLMRFGADRGGVATLPRPILTDVDDAIGVWTEANDQNPTDPTTKPCLTVTCPEEEQTLVEAITRCLEFGNFRARYFPEQIQAWMELAGVAHARFAEQRLLATISTGSTAVTAGQVLGTSRDVLAALDRAISVWKYRYRLADGFRLVFGAPRWLRDQIRTDIARQLPVGTVAETLALADATIDQFFAARDVDPEWLLDGEAGQQFTVQGAGVLQGWPSTVKTYMFPAGDWLFLDGGTLDLGLVRDSTLNSTNDVQMFAETFEGAHHVGVESWTLTFDTCPDGSVSSTVDISPCSTGS